MAEVAMLLERERDELIARKRKLEKKKKKKSEGRMTEREPSN